VFSVATCAQIAAVFMLSELPPGALHDDFRRRAIRATVAVWILGALPAIAAGIAAPIVREALTKPIAIGCIVVALAAGLAVIVCVATRRDGGARIAVGVEALAILGGWFGAQAPALVPGRYTYVSAASSDAMIVAFLIATAAGFVVLVPSLLLLFRVFKRVPG
jgi:cytochrome bd ubiquinol oxidase subunit II